MMLLVSGGTAVVNRLIGHPNLGVLLVPAAGNRVPPEGVVFAADNGAFGRFDAKRFRAFLKRLSGSTCMWVACPDRVGDHKATLAMWKEWNPQIRAHYLPAAFVAQDGCGANDVPWADLRGAVFIGGTTRYKTGPHAVSVIHEAKQRGIRVHMGRVNTLSRLLFASVLGVDSVDGSKFSKYSETYIPNTLNFLASLDKQRLLKVPA